MTKYRIVEVSTGRFIVEERFMWCWHPMTKYRWTRYAGRATDGSVEACKDYIRKCEYQKKNFPKVVRELEIK